MAGILIVTVEADQGIIAVLDAFTGAGHQATLVNHGLDALEALASSRFDAICIQVKDLERDGVALARIIRECRAYAQVHLVAIVDDVTCREQMAMLAAGVDHVLPASISPTAISRSVQQRLGAGERIPNLLEAFAAASDTRPRGRHRSRGAWRIYAVN